MSSKIRSFAFMCFAVILLLGMSKDCFAQVANNIGGLTFGRAEVQNGPENPQTRGRLFNLQTGHAGAFYNCDGEEDKRYSPHICWNTSCKRPWYRSVSDVLRWKRDRNEIAQRICDGAGACCGTKCKSASCGCADCSQVVQSEVFVANASEGSAREALVQSDSQENAASTIWNKPQLIPRLFSTRSKEPESEVPAKGVNPRATAQSQPEIRPIKKTAVHSASLLERARAATRR